MKLIIKKVSLPERITNSLYNKYAESQNYYFTKDINEIILDQPTKPNIVFKVLLKTMMLGSYFNR
jgi:hypothetical protein